MFRKIAIAVIGIFISITSFAHENLRHYSHYAWHQGYDRFYRAHMTIPIAGYYMTPNPFYQSRPIPYFSQYGDMPSRCEEREAW